MVNYVMIGNVRAEEIFGSKENVLFILHAMNCCKKICLIIAALEKVDTGADWCWNVNYPSKLAEAVARLVAEKLQEDIAIPLQELTKYVLEQVYDQDGNLREGLV